MARLPGFLLEFWGETSAHDELSRELSEILKSVWNLVSPQLQNNLKLTLTLIQSEEVILKRLMCYTRFFYQKPFYKNLVLEHQTFKKL